MSARLFVSIVAGAMLLVLSPGWASAQESIPEYCPPKETFIGWVNGPPPSALAQQLQIAQDNYAAAVDSVSQIEATGQLAEAWTAVANDRAYLIRWGVACHGA